VEERLPENPLVMEPWEEMGKYGGTLNWCEFTIDYDHYLRHLNEVEPLELPPSSVHHRYSGPGGAIEPGILEFWEMSKDGKTFTFRIRKGLKWSDGVPVTTEDVRYTIEDVTLNKEATPVLPTWAKWGGEPVKLEVIDDYTFRLKFVKPYGIFLDQIRGWSYESLIEPSHYLKQFHKKYTSWDKLLPVMEKHGYKGKDEWGRFYSYIQGYRSAGGFIPTRMPNVFHYPTLRPWIPVEEPNPGEFILERNPYFYKVDTEGNQLPYIDRLHRSYVTDLEVENMKIISGETDLQFQFIRLSDYPLFKRNEEKGGYNVMPLKTWQAQMLHFILNLCPNDPVLREIVQDVRFRRAMSLALNREDFKESIFLGFGRPAQGTVWRGSEFYEEEFEKAYAEYDPDRANKLLDEMGLKWDENHQYRLRPDGKKLTLPLVYYDVTPPATPGAELASEYWKEIGIHVPLKHVNGQYYWKIHNANEYVLTAWWICNASPVGRWFGNFAHIPMWWQWYTTNGEKGVEPPAVVKRVYELYEIVQSTPSREERIKAGKEIMRIHAENLWSIGTVAGTKSPFIYSKKLGNISVAEKKDYYSITVAEAAEQWFFKK